MTSAAQDLDHQAQAIHAHVERETRKHGEPALHVQMVIAQRQQDDRRRVVGEATCASRLAQLLRKEQCYSKEEGGLWLSELP